MKIQDEPWFFLHFRASTVFQRQSPQSHHGINTDQNGQNRQQHGINTVPIRTIPAELRIITDQRGRDTDSLG
ncbi:hypothetical protein DPMN_194031 [Dreissena polymorpha]|uniref:Uncharacterized protein n=1 Tax=Dreissena polymorpha TaxID=45954 RepID=A0A9D3Y311_DREPO|nr:hypothetical protein DPMN_194031 [Dreissena polymorpha]